MAKTLTFTADMRQAIREAGAFAGSLKTIEKRTGETVRAFGKLEKAGRLDDKSLTLQGNQLRRLTRDAKQYAAVRRQIAQQSEGRGSVARTHATTRVGDTNLRLTSVGRAAAASGSRSELAQAARAVRLERDGVARLVREHRGLARSTANLTRIQSVMDRRQIADAARLSGFRERAVAAQASARGRVEDIRYRTRGGRDLDLSPAGRIAARTGGTSAFAARSAAVAEERRARATELRAYRAREGDRTSKLGRRQRLRALGSRLRFGVLGEIGAYEGFRAVGRMAMQSAATREELGVGNAQFEQEVTGLLSLGDNFDHPRKVKNEVLRAAMVYRVPRQDAIGAMFAAQSAFSDPKDQANVLRAAGKIQQAKGGDFSQNVEVVAKAYKNAADEFGGSMTRAADVLAFIENAGQIEMSDLARSAPEVFAPWRQAGFTIPELGAAAQIATNRLGNNDQTFTQFRNLGGRLTRNSQRALGIDLKGDLVEQLTQVRDAMAGMDRTEKSRSMQQLVEEQGSPLLLTLIDSLDELKQTVDQFKNVPENYLQNQITQRTLADPAFRSAIITDQTQAFIENIPALLANNSQLGGSDEYLKNQTRASMIHAGAALTLKRDNPYATEDRIRQEAEAAYLGGGSKSRAYMETFLQYARGSGYSAVSGIADKSAIDEAMLATESERLAQGEFKFHSNKTAIPGVPQFIELDRRTGQEQAEMFRQLFEAGYRLSADQFMEGLRRSLVDLPGKATRVDRDLLRKNLSKFGPQRSTAVSRRSQSPSEQQRLMRQFIPDAPSLPSGSDIAGTAFGTALPGLAAVVGQLGGTGSARNLLGHLAGRLDGFGAKTSTYLNQRISGPGKVADSILEAMQAQRDAAVESGDIAGVGETQGRLKLTRRLRNDVLQNDGIVDERETAGIVFGAETGESYDDLKERADKAQRKLRRAHAVAAADGRINNREADSLSRLEAKRDQATDNLNAASESLKNITRGLEILIQENARNNRQPNPSARP